MDQAYECWEIEKKVLGELKIPSENFEPRDEEIDQRLDQLRIKARQIEEHVEVSSLSKSSVSTAIWSKERNVELDLDSGNRRADMDERIDSQEELIQAIPVS